MSISNSQQRDELLGSIRNALWRAELYCARARHWDTCLLLASIICGALANVLAGGTVVAGESALHAIAAGDLPTANALETFQRISEEHAACLG